MPDLAIEWSRADLANIEHAIRQEVAWMDKAPGEAVKHAFIEFGKSGRSHTRKGLMRREVIPNPRRRPRRQGIAKSPGITRAEIARRRAAKGRRDDPQNAWAPFLVKFLYQHRPPRYVGVAKKSSPLRIIGRRHLASKVWGAMMYEVYNGKALDWPARLNVRPKAVQAVKDGTKAGTNPYVEFHDKLVYLLKIHPDIGHVAMQAAANRMRHQLDGRIKAEMLRLWRS